MTMFIWSHFPFKICSLLDLLERLDVEDINLFQTRGGDSMRKMLIIGNVLSAEIVEKINKSGAYGLLSDGVTDISNQHQNISFIKYFDEIIGDAATVFIDTCDLLAEGDDDEKCSADSETTFNSLVNLLKRLGLSLSDLKGMASDGASVMTGEKSGVGARSKALEECHILITVHCICHRLALPCGDTGDQMAFVQPFETTMLSLWTFFKNSPKRLTIYIKVALGYRDFSSFSKNKKRKVVRTVKKAVRTRWLSLHNSVDSVFVEYLGIVKALEQIGDATAIGNLRKIKNVDFVGKLYLFKYALPHLSALSKTFQTGAINFSKIKPNILKTNSKLQKLKDDDAPHIKQLEKDLHSDGRLGCLDMNFNEHAKTLIIGRTEAYVNSICGNIDDRFPQASTDVLCAFDIFNVENIPGDTASQLFTMYGQSEMKIIAQHYYKQNPEKSSQLLEEWEDFKYDLLEVKKKWQQFKENVEYNKMKLKISATEWTLKHLMRNHSSIDQSLIKDVIKIAIVIPVSNAWPERGASAIKRIKSRLRSSMGDDLLRCLLMISLNGPKPGTQDADEFLMRVLKSFEEQRHYKVPSKQSKIRSLTSEIAVQVNDDIDDIDTRLESLDKQNDVHYFDMISKDPMSDEDDDDYFPNDDEEQFDDIF